MSRFKGPLGVICTCSGVRRERKRKFLVLGGSSFKKESGKRIERKKGRGR
jgi:hypothetical protein